MYKEGHDNHYNMSMNKIGVWQCKKTLDCNSTVNTNIARIVKTCCISRLYVELMISFISIIY